MQFRGLRVLPGYFWSFVFTAVLPQVALGAGPVLPSFTEFFFLRVGSNEPTQKKKNGGDKAVRVGARSPVFFFLVFLFCPKFRSNDLVESGGPTGNKKERKYPPKKNGAGYTHTKRQKPPWNRTPAATGKWKKKNSVKKNSTRSNSKRFKNCSMVTKVDRVVFLWPTRINRHLDPCWSFLRAKLGKTR